MDPPPSFESHSSSPLPPLPVNEMDIEAEIRHSEQLAQNGYFQDALSLLDDIAETNSGSEKILGSIYRAAARVVMPMGYPEAAEEYLSKASQLSHERLDKVRILSLRIHLAYVTIIGCGKALSDTSSLDEAKAYLSSSTILVDHDAIEMQSQIDKISIVEQVFVLRENSDVKPRIASRMLPMIKLALKQHRYRDLWLLSSPYCNAAKSNDVVAWLQECLEEEQLPKILRANLSLEFAKLLGDLSRLDECAAWLTIADQAFKNCNHAFGHLEVRRFRLHYGFIGAANVLAELVDITNQYLKANYPFGVLQSALFPLTLAVKSGNYAIHIQLQETFHNICKITGMRHERLLLDMQLLATLNATATYYGRVMELGQELYRQCVELKYWTMVYNVGSVMTIAQDQYQNQAAAEKLAQELYTMCQRESLQVQSEAAYTLGVIRTSRIFTKTSDRLIFCQEMIQWLLGKAEVDVTTCAWRLACEKLSFVAGLQFEIARNLNTDYDLARRAADETISKVRDLASRLQPEEKIITMGNCDVMIITQLIFEAKKTSDEEKELQAIAMVGNLIKDYEAEGLNFQAAQQYQFRALCNISRYRKERDWGKRGQFLIDMEQDYRTSTDKLESLGFYRQALVARHGLSRTHYEAHVVYKIPSSDVINGLLSLEAIGDALRRELSTLGSLSALLQKQRFTAQDQLKDLYSWATAITLEEKQYDQLWLWSQKRKARSLSDMLGLGVIVPASIKQAILQNATAEGLFEKLNSLVTSLAATPQEEKGYIRQHIDDTEAEIRRNPVMKEFVALREGAVNDITQLQTLQNQQPAFHAPSRKVVFVDWIVQGSTLHMLTACASNPKETLRIFKLPILIVDVESWLKEHFSDEKARRDCLMLDNLRDLTKPMRTLDPLISHLQEISSEGDLLILSPTRCLSALPLHALVVCTDEAGRGMALIERNPVVYTPSFPVLEMCLTRSLTSSPGGKRVFLGNFDQQVEAEKIYSQMRSLARSFDGESYCGSQATKSSFGTIVKDARLVHYHGHCRFTAENVLEQALVLAPVVENPSIPEMETVCSEPAQSIARKDEDIHNIPIKSILSRKLPGTDMNKFIEQTANENLLSHTEADAATYLTVEDIFKLYLSSPLVVLIACESASQTISPGDEPLGLIAGFLCASAASVIGASWPIPSISGRAFSEAFYEQLGDSEEDLVDLAVVVQEAVLTVRDELETSATYFWGGFCLYGSWMFKKGDGKVADT